MGESIATDREARVLWDVEPLVPVDRPRVGELATRDEVEGEASPLVRGQLAHRPVYGIPYPAERVGQELRSGTPPGQKRLGAGPHE